MRLEAREGVSRCPYCHDDASGPTCEGCGAVSHEACLREHGGCAACGSGVARRRPPPGLPRRAVGAARDSMRNAWDDWASGRLETTADDGRGSFYVLDGTELRREVERRERSYQEHIDAMTSKHEAEMRELRRTPGMALALGAAAAALTWLVLNVLRP